MKRVMYNLSNPSAAKNSCVKSCGRTIFSMMDGDSKWSRDIMVLRSRHGVRMNDLFSFIKKGVKSGDEHTCSTLRSEPYRAL